MKTRTNKSLRVFLAMCLLVQIIMPSMMWESKAVGDGSISVKYDTDASVAIYDVYLVIDGVSPLLDATNTGFLGTLKTHFDITESDDTLANTAILEKLNALDNDSAGSFSLASALAASVSSLLPTESIALYKNAEIAAVNYTPTVSGLDYGYYLIVDKTSEFSPMLVTVDSATTVATEPKSGIPTIEKFIQHNEHSTDVDEGWGKYGDNQMGEAVNFKVITTVPSKIDSFDADDNDLVDGDLFVYYYTIHDVMDAEQFSFTSEELTVSVDGGATLTDGTEYNVTYVRDGDGAVVGWTLTLDINASGGARALLGETLIIEYSAVLKTTANYGNKQNQNDVYLYYSKDTNSSWTGGVDDAYTNGSFTGEESDVDKSEVGYFEDTVYDYTFAFVMDKINNATPTPEHVADATFEIYDVTNGANTTPLKFSLLDSVTDGDGVITNYYTLNNSGAVTEFTTNENGTFLLIGLDDTRTYRIFETVIPERHSAETEYVDFIITATPNSTTNLLDTFSVEATDDAAADYNTNMATSDGVVTATIVNNAVEYTLPETGGVGTVMFYVAGVGMMGAAAFLIYKRKES